MFYYEVNKTERTNTRQFTTAPPPVNNNNITPLFYHAPADEHIKHPAAVPANL